MKLIVGLGNPTSDYEHTRHNLGANVITQLASTFSVGIKPWANWRDQGLVADLTAHGQLIKLFKPATFMNMSGQAVKKIKSFFKIPLVDIWIIHDDLDLPVGAVRLSYGSSAAGHNGVQNIIDELGSKNFWRFRLGIGRSTAKIPPHKFVLLPFNSSEKKLMTAFASQASQKIIHALEVGPDIYINKFNE